MKQLAPRLATRHPAAAPAGREPAGPELLGEEGLGGNAWMAEQLSGAEAGGSSWLERAAGEVGGEADPEPAPAWAAEEALSFDVAGLLGAAERSLGVSLAGVELVGGPEGEERAGPRGAFATAIGDRIYVGREVAALGSREQELVMAHELAHVAQQRAPAGGGAAGRAAGGEEAAEGGVEADADRLAAAVLAGEQAAPGVAVGGSEAHDLSLDAIQRVGEAVVEAGTELAESVVEAGRDLVEAGVELVGEGVEALISGLADAGELLSWLSSVDEATARSGLELASVVRGDLVEGLIVLAPAHALAGLALSLLPEVRVPAVLSQLDGATIALLLLAVPAVALTPILPALAALDVALLGAVLASLDPKLREQVLETLGEAVRDPVSGLVDAVLPPDSGVAFACDVAATFPIAMKVGGGGGFEFFNRGGGTFEILVNAESIAAVAGGIGVGASVGTGGAEGGIEEGGVGLGMDASAGAEGGTRLVMEAMYAADLFAVDGPAALYALATSAAHGQGLAGAATQGLLAAGIQAFHRSTSVREEAYVAGNAGADVGVRTGSAETLPVFSAGEAGSEGADAGGVTTWWQELLRAFGEAQLRAGVGVTLGLETPEWTSTEQGIPVPREAAVTVEASGGGLVELFSAVPLFPDVTPPDLGLDVGVRATFPVLTDGELAYDLGDPTWTSIGSARCEDHRVSVESDIADLPGLDTTWAEWLDSLGETRLGWTVNAGAPVAGRALAAALAGHDDLRGRMGIQLEGEVTYGAVLDAETLRAVCERMVGERSDESRFEVVRQAVTGLLTTGDASGLVEGWDLLVDGVARGYTGTHARLVAGASLGGEVGGGAGVELSAEVGVSGSYLLDVTLDEAPAEEEASSLLAAEGLEGPRTVVWS